MNILGYLLLAFIAVGFVLCWVAMAIGTIKAFQKKDKGKKKKKLKSSDSQNTIKNKVEEITFEKDSSRIEGPRIKDNDKIANRKKYIFSI